LLLRAEKFEDFNSFAGHEFAVRVAHPWFSDYIAKRDGRDEPGHDRLLNWSFATGDLSQRFQTDLGRPACRTKIFRLTCRANQFYQLAPSFPDKRGGSRVVTNAGGDAVDAAASARRLFAGRFPWNEPQRAGRTALVAYGKTVWSRHPLLVPSRRWRHRSNRIRVSHQAGSDGDKTNSLAGESTA
jgi:hypothetical protein